VFSLEALYDFVGRVVATFVFGACAAATSPTALRRLVNDLPPFGQIQ